MPHAEYVYVEFMSILYDRPMQPHRLAELMDRRYEYVCSVANDLIEWDFIETLRSPRRWMLTEEGRQVVLPHLDLYRARKAARAAREEDQRRRQRDLERRHREGESKRRAEERARAESHQRALERMRLARIEMEQRADLGERLWAERNGPPHVFSYPLDRVPALAVTRDGRRCWNDFVDEFIEEDSRRWRIGEENMPEEDRFPTFWTAAA